MYGEWFYIDHVGIVQGPFGSQSMSAWAESGYFSSTLQIKLRLWSAFHCLSVVFPRPQTVFKELTQEPIVVFASQRQPLQPLQHQQQQPQQQQKMLNHQQVQLLPQARQQSADLNKRITGAQSWEDVLSILRSATPCAVNCVIGVNVATAFHRAAKLGSQARRRPQEADLGHVIALIESKLDEFEPRQIANTLWAYATLGLAPSASVLGALSTAVERLAGAFKPQEIANTLWAYATLGLAPSASVLEALSTAVERSAGAFKPQNVANALWAYATLGLAPSASVLEALSTAVERSAGAFNAQNVANALWAYAVLLVEPPSILVSLVSVLGTASDVDKHLEQISYAYLVGHALGWSWQLPNELVQKALSVQRRRAQQPNVSRLQQRVHDALRGMGQLPELEALTEDGLFSIDIALPASGQDDRPKTAVEVDGPSHFTSSGGKTGSTQLRDFLLEQRGWRVVSLPYFAIEGASTDEKLKEYLANALSHE